MSEQNRNSVSPTVDAAPAPLLAKKLRVLAVDDSENDLHLLTRALSRVKSWSVDLKTCSTPHEFLAAVECRANDLLFIDHRLGAVTGLQLLKTIRDTGSTVPAIFLTGIGDERVAVEVMQAGACDYLPKEDLSAARLERAIDGALDRHRREMEEVEKVERLEHERQDLQTKSEEMEDHYRGSSLDLTTPLSMVTEILSEIRRGAPGPLTHDQIELLDAASEGCARIARGMDDLLGVGRLAGGPVSLWIRREDLATLVEHAATGLSTRLESAGIRLEVHTTPGMPPAAVDRMRVHQVLANLVDLALERVPANGRIEIEARQDECDPGFQVVSVADSGPEMSPEDVERLQDCLCRPAGSAQSEDEIDRRFLVSRDIVAGHGGSVGIAKESSGGTAVWFSLPVHSAGDRS